MPISQAMLDHLPAPQDRSFRRPQILMPGFVPDASATLPWRFEDEATPWSEALLNRIESWEEALVPAHLPLDVANALLIARRRGRVNADQVQEFIEDLGGASYQDRSPKRPGAMA